MWLLILDWVIKYLIYYEDVFGKVIANRGITTLTAQILVIPPIALVYLYYIFAKEEKIFSLVLIMTFSKIALLSIFLSYTFDAAIY